MKRSFIIKKQQEKKLHSNNKETNDFDKEKVKTLAFFNLIKVLKNKHMFCNLRASVAITPFSAINGVSSIYYHLASFSSIVAKQELDNPFAKCMTYKELLRVIDEFVVTRNARTSNDKETNIQLYITDCINIILHYCVERTINRSKESLKILEEIGKEVFDLTCTKLFGDGFEDKTLNVKPLHHVFTTDNFNNNEAFQLLFDEKSKGVLRVSWEIPSSLESSSSLYQFDTDFINAYGQLNQNW